MSAAQHAQIAVSITVVADACTDDTAAVARAHGADVVTIDARSVGAARSAGFAHCLSSSTTQLQPPTWLATTDADTLVPHDWFVRQRDHLHDGADIVVGTVTLLPDHASNHAPGSRWTAWEAAYARRISTTGHSHMHGANLAFTVDSYSALGGFRPLQTGEDVDFVRRAHATDQQVVWALDMPVATSARLTGRAPFGMAQDLRESLPLHRSLEVGS